VASVTKIGRLVVFRGILAVYPENYTKHVSTVCEQSNELLTL